MGHPAPSLGRTRLIQTVVVVLEHVLPACTGIDYRLLGTGAALLHGVHLPAADVDITVEERQAVDAFGFALASFPCLQAPTWLPETRQFLRANGCDIDLVRRGMAAAGLAQAMQDDVLRRLEQAPARLTDG